MLDEDRGIQWPWPSSVSGKGTAEEVVDGRGPGPEGRERRLFEDGRFFHADGRARFLYEEVAGLPEPCDETFPYTLLTGRGTSAQWHTNTRTSKSAVLRKLHPPTVYVEMNRGDAERLGIREGSPVEVSTRRGRVVASAVPVTSLRPGQVFMPMHYRETNQLTLEVVDPLSRQPSYKACAAGLRRVEPPGPAA